MPRTIAIGDIHGMSDSLRALLDRIEPQSDDRFVFLGDYFDRGPDSKGVADQLVALAQRYECRFVMGNHCEMMLGATLGRSDYDYWLKFGGRATLLSYGITAPVRASAPFALSSLPAEHQRLFGSLENYVETEDAIFVHAGLNPTLPMSAQVGDMLRWTAPVEDLRHQSGKLICCGHVPHSHAVRIGDCWHVDTGAGVRLSGTLSGVDIHSGQVWMVPAGSPVS